MLSYLYKRKEAPCCKPLPFSFTVLLASEVAAATGVSVAMAPVRSRSVYRSIVVRSSCRAYGRTVVRRSRRPVRVVPSAGVRGMPCAVVVVVHSGLGYMAVSIEAVASVVVAPLVSHEYRWMSIVVAVPVVVRVDSE